MLKRHISGDSRAKRLLTTIKKTIKQLTTIYSIMETTILAKIYERANSSMNYDETTKTMLHDVKCEMHTLSGAIKAIKAQSNEAKSAIDYLLASYDLDIKTLSPKKLMAKIPNELYNQKRKVCKVRRNYEYEDVQIFRTVEGKPMPVCKDGKPVTRKMPKLDADDKKIVKDYTLCEIKKWDVDTIFEVLRQVDEVAMCKQSDAQGGTTNK